MTHNGAFHCDEVLALYILRQTVEYSGSTFIHSRNRSVIAGADVAVDVGGEYDLAKCRFDHHQRGFDEVFGPKKGPRQNRTKISSAGLIYRHFGREAIGNILKASDVVLTSAKLEAVYNKVYDVFVEAVDAIDNGFDRHESASPSRYHMGSGLSSRVGEKNAEWNEPSGDEAQKVKFEEALTMVGGTEFDVAVLKNAKCWLPGRRVLEQAMDERTKYDTAGRVLVLQNWVQCKAHLIGA